MQPAVSPRTLGGGSTSLVSPVRLRVERPTIFPSCMGRACISPLWLRSRLRRPTKLLTHWGTARKRLWERLREESLGAEGSPGMVVSLLRERLRVLRDGDHWCRSGRAAMLLLERSRWTKLGSSRRQLGIVVRAFDPALSFTTLIYEGISLQLYALRWKMGELNLRFEGRCPWLRGEA